MSKLIKLKISLTSWSHDKTSAFIYMATMWSIRFEFVPKYYN